MRCPKFIYCDYHWEVRYIIESPTLTAATEDICYGDWKSCGKWKLALPRKDDDNGDNVKSMR